MFDANKLNAIKLTSASVTHTGNVRQVNEDSILDVPENIWAIADGMGGYAAGDIASRLVVNALANAAIRIVEENTSDKREEIVEETLQQVNRKLVFEMTIHGRFREPHAFGHFTHGQPTQTIFDDQFHGLLKDFIFSAAVHWRSFGLLS